MSHVVLNARPAEPSPDRQGGDRSHFVELLARRHAERTGLSFESARRIVEAVSIVANPIVAVDGDLLHYSARVGRRIARYG